MPSAANPQTLNRYSYGLNNPVKFADPTGHWVETALDIAGIAYDIYEINRDGLNWVNGIALGVDVACAVLPIATGGGMVVRAVAHADDAFDAVHAANAFVDVAHIVENASDVAGGVTKAAKSASKYWDLRHAGIGTDTVSNLKKLVKQNHLKDVQVHHLIEERFAKLLNLDPEKIPGIVLTKAEHQRFTNAWRDFIGYTGQKMSLTTKTASPEDVWKAAQEVYKDFPELLEAVRAALFPS